MGRKPRVPQKLGRSHIENFTVKVCYTERKMISKTLKQMLSVFMCTTLLAWGTTPAFAFQDQASPQDSSQTSSQTSSSAPAPAPLSPDQLDALVAPIALYPDALVAQVLAAAGYPDQVAFASDWLAQNQNLTGTALTQAVNQQSWDPS